MTNQIQLSMKKNIRTSDTKLMNMSDQGKKSNKSNSKKESSLLTEQKFKEITMNSSGFKIKTEVIR